MHVDDVDRVVLYRSEYDVSNSLARVPHPYAREHAVEWVNRNRTPHLAENTGFVLDLGDGLIGGIGLRSADGIPDIGY